VLLAILSLATIVFSCKKTTISAPKEPALFKPSALITDTLFVDGHIASETAVTLAQCPFTNQLVYANFNETTSWDTTTIVKYTYITHPLEGYFIKNAIDPYLTLVIIYNPETSATMKMIIAGVPNLSQDPVIDVAYEFKDTSNNLHIAMTINEGAGTGSDVRIGNVPAFGALGTVSFAPRVGCLRTSGFSECIVCSATECASTWWCIITCGAYSGACVAGWVIACGILNV